MRNRTLPGLAAAVMILAACSDTTAPLNDPETLMLSADVARVAADGIGEDVELMRDPTFGQRFVLLGAPLAGPFTDQCSYDGEWHTCGPFERGQLTFLRQVAFHGASGTPMESFDAHLTASVRIITSVDGELSHEAWSASVERHRDMTVTGLQGDEQSRTWNGSGTNLTRRSRHSDGGAARSYDMDASFAVQNVVVPRSNNDQKDHWPLSGTITRTVHVTVLDQDGELLREAARTVTVTFNGTQFATMTVTGGGGTETFELDLGQRRAHRKP